MDIYIKQLKFFLKCETGFVKIIILALSSLSRNQTSVSNPIYPCLKRSL